MAKGNITPEMLETIKQHLSILDTHVFTASGLITKLEAEIDGGYLKIFSDKDYSEEMGAMGKIVFAKLTIEWWGGSYIEKENMIWFNPHVSYQHPTGGTNGSKFIWDSVWFDLNENKWIFRK